MFIKAASTQGCESLSLARGIENHPKYGKENLLKWNGLLNMHLHVLKQVRLLRRYPVCEIWILSYGIAAITFCTRAILYQPRQLVSPLMTVDAILISFMHFPSHPRCGLPSAIISSVPVITIPLLTAVLKDPIVVLKTVPMVPWRKIIYRLASEPGFYDLPV